MPTLEVSRDGLYRTEEEFCPSFFFGSSMAVLNVQRLIEDEVKQTSNERGEIKKNVVGAAFGYS